MFAHIFSSIFRFFGVLLCMNEFMDEFMVENFDFFYCLTLTNTITKKTNDFMERIHWILNEFMDVFMVTILNDFMDEFMVVFMQVLMLLIYTNTITKKK